MTTLAENPNFAEDFQRLRGVSLNPERHTAPNALAHTLLVAERVRHLARANDVDADGQVTLEALALLHDIGKVSGSSKPAKSVELLPRYGVEEPGLVALVKYHDVNLPWFISVQRGQAPTDKAWRKLTRAVDMRLLCLFMVADRIDCPGGWRENAPLMWFLSEARARGYLTDELRLDDCEASVEHSAGVILVDKGRALTVRLNHGGLELPKGHLEQGESAERAALRELREEAAVQSQVALQGRAATTEYCYRRRNTIVYKLVEYFIGESDGPLHVGPLPRGTLERRWVSAGECEALDFAHETLRPLVMAALEGDTMGNECTSVAHAQ